jgi:hypothetical protein
MPAALGVGVTILGQRVNAVTMMLESTAACDKILRR